MTTYSFGAQNPFTIPLLCLVRIFGACKCSKYCRDYDRLLGLTRNMDTQQTNFRDKRYYKRDISTSLTSHPLTNNDPQQSLNTSMSDTGSNDIDLQYPDDTLDSIEGLDMQFINELAINERNRIQQRKVLQITDVDCSIFSRSSEIRNTSNPPSPSQNIETNNKQSLLRRICWIFC